MPFTGAKEAHHVFHHADAHVEEFALPGSIVVGHCGFQQMAGVVVLVHGHIRPAFVQASQGVIGVDVPVFLLGGGNFVDPLVALGFQFGIGFGFEGISHGFQGFEYVRVVVKNAFKFAIASTRYPFKIADAARFDLGLFNTNRDGYTGHFVHARLPKCVGNLYS